MSTFFVDMRKSRRILREKCTKNGPGRRSCANPVCRTVPQERILIRKHRGIVRAFPTTRARTCALCLAS